MAAFEQALILILAHEGMEYSNDAFDTGGETWLGISKNNWPEWFAKVEAAKDEEGRMAIARQFYLEEFWIPGQFNLISNQDVANQLMDINVNCGIGALHSEIERLQHWLNGIYGCGLVVDGVLGPKTAHVIDEHPRSVLNRIIADRLRFYEIIVSKNPSQQRFMRGWVERI